MNVLITGASGGLGRAFALECARRGYDLLLTDIDAAGLAKAAVGIRRQYGARVETYACDITDETSVDAMIVYAKEKGIALHMLFNVAGLDFEGAFHKRSFSDLSSILRVNIEATLRITHKALALRDAQRDFYIIFVSSLASLYPIPLKATYAASKRFLLDFSIALGEELRPLGVHVLALCPGGLSTREDCLQAIAAQGFWGNATTNDIEKVVRRTINRALRGKTLYIPGLVNNIFRFVSRLVPPGVIARLLHRRWLHAQEQWLTLEEHVR
ncbi:MAG: SDR family NAD(P)-dependent oxidoreductase [Bacillota bacterium]